MSYIGNSPTSVAFLTDTFSGNGSTTAFTLSAAPATTSSILVAISGVLQDPSTYSVVGTTLTFSPAPPTGTGNISVRFLGIPASGVTTTAYRTVTEFTATSGQTTFSVPSYTPGFIDVYRNGVLLGSADYTASNGVSVVLVNGCTAGDLVEVISFQVSSVLNAVQSTGTTFSGNVLFASGNGIWNTSGNVGVGTASPSARLHVNAGANYGSINFQAVNGTDLKFMSGSTMCSSIAVDSNSGASPVLLFRTGSSDTERMRIDSSGKLLVGATSATFTMPSTGGASFKASTTGGGVPIVEVGNTDSTSSSDASPSLIVFKNSSTTSSSARFIQFSASGAATTMGAIVGNGAGVCQFANFSDISLKKNIQPLTGSLNKILALKPSSYDMIADDSHVNAGFIAQDVQKVYPEYVIENMSNEGEKPLMGLTGGLSGGIIAELVAAIQEQQAIINDLKARIELLENK